MWKVRNYKPKGDKQWIYPISQLGEVRILGSVVFTPVYPKIIHLDSSKYKSLTYNSLKSGLRDKTNPYEITGNDENNSKKG